MPNWDGKTERRSNASDHDNITRTLTILEIQVKNFDEHRRDFKSHLEDDKKRFDFLDKSVWMIFGGMVIIEFYFKIIK